MDFQQALTYLYERLPMFQRVGAKAFKKDLTNTIRLLEGLGNPHHHFQSIHIAGTNGKGTSAHAIASILQEAGYKTGLYTSPHLRSFTERIRLNGQEVSESFMADFISTHQAMIEQINPSFFEVTVAMAFECFKVAQVDIAVIETGLGGRLDSTNVIDPLVALITMIGWDHADMLGDTLEKIAFEKAGIMKSGRPVIIGADQPDLLPVFQNRANEINASLSTASQVSVSSIEQTGLSQTFMVVEHHQKNVYQTDITADYFLKNVPGILDVINALIMQGFKIDQPHIQNGFSKIKSNTGLKGRWQVLSKNPLMIADVSHNEPGLKLLFEQVDQLCPGRLHLVMGVVKDKDLSKIFDLLPRLATFYLTQSSVPRSLDAKTLKVLAEGHGLKGEAFDNVNQAINMAKKNAHQDDLILICGSTFVVAEIEDL